MRVTSGNIIFGICISFLLMNQGCRTDETPVVSESLLEGTWLVDEAYRSNRKTRLLENGEFTFTPSNQFSTNILQDTSLYNYILNEQIIYVEDSARSRYQVINLTLDTLTLQSTISDFDFKFILIKDQKNEMQ